MTDYTLVKCVNCGKQNMVMADDPFDVKCEFSDRDNTHAVRIKEGNMFAQINAKEPHPETKEKLGIDKSGGQSPVPPKPKKRKKLMQYFEDNKEAILHDYKTMKLRDFLHKWMAVNTWQQLKKKWGVQGKLQVKPRTKTPDKEKKTATAADIIAAIDKLEKGWPRLPDFPNFDNSWSPLVQEKWLETYAQLVVKR